MKNRLCGLEAGSILAVMKTQFRIVSLVLLLAFGLPFAGCTTTGGTAGKGTTAFDPTSYLSPAAATAGMGLILSAKDPKKKAQYAQYILDVALAIETVVAVPAPTPEALKKAIDSVPAAGQDYAKFGLTIVEQYRAVYQSTSANDPKVGAYLKQIAAGLESAAMPWTTQVSTSGMRMWMMYHPLRDPFTKNFGSQLV